jgi:hypothetical protein
VIDQRQGVPEDAMSVLPLVTFALYNPKASVELVLIAEAKEVNVLIGTLAALSPNHRLPENFKIKTFKTVNEFVRSFPKFYNSTVPFGKFVAFITDREDPWMKRKIGAKRNLLTVVGDLNPLKQTASALLAADKLLDESVWSKGYHFVSIGLLGGLDAMMAELTGYLAAQKSLSASA